MCLNKSLPYVIQILLSKNPPVVSMVTLAELLALAEAVVPARGVKPAGAAAALTGLCTWAHADPSRARQIASLYMLRFAGSTLRRSSDWLLRTRSASYLSPTVAVPDMVSDLP